MAKDKSERIELSAIVLDTGDGREVRLTVEQARSLHRQLDALFGERVRYVPSQPVYIPWRTWPRDWWDYSPRITWCDSTATIKTNDDSAGLRVRYEGSTTAR